MLTLHSTSQPWDICLVFAVDCKLRRFTRVFHPLCCVLLFTLCTSWIAVAGTFRFRNLAHPPCQPLVASVFSRSRDSFFLSAVNKKQDATTISCPKTPQKKNYPMSRPGASVHEWLMRLMFLPVTTFLWHVSQLSCSKGAAMCVSP